MPGEGCPRRVVPGSRPQRGRHPAGWPPRGGSRRSTFTNTDFDSFGGAIAEARRVLKRGGRFVHVGNHPCFLGATQEDLAAGFMRLHPSYRGAGRRDAASAPGASAGGWRARLGPFVHLPLADFLGAFRGFTLEAFEELNDGVEYPKTIASSWTKP